MGDVDFKFNLQDKIKNNKPFNVRDLWIYGIILVLIAIAFFFMFFQKSKKADGFIIYLDGKKVMTFFYDDNKDYNYELEQDFADYVKIDLHENKITVYINAEKTEYNVLSIDTENHKTKVIESTCNTHDCEYMENEIYCAPHLLRVTPIQKDGNIKIG